MTGFNMPPGCSPSMIPGNRPEDLAYEAAWEWVEEQLKDLSLDELRRAVLIGKAAVEAERQILIALQKEWQLEGRMAEAAEHGF